MSGTIIYSDFFDSGISSFFAIPLTATRTTLFFFVLFFRVYQLHSHDIKGCKNEECLERAKILYTLTTDEVSNHVPRTVEEFQKGTSKAIIYIEEASGNVFKRVTQPIAWSVTALSATVTVVAGIGGATIQTGAGFVASGRSFSPLYQLDVKCA